MDQWVWLYRQCMIYVDFYICFAKVIASVHLQITKYILKVDVVQNALHWHVSLLFHRVYF